MNGVITNRVIISDLREWSGYLYFLVLPISLMFLLGAILQNSFGSRTTTADPIHVQVVAKQAGTQSSRQLVKSLTAVHTKGLTFTQRSSVKQAKQVVRYRSNTAAVIVGKNVQVLTATGTSDYQLALLKGVLVEVFQSVALAKATIKFNGQMTSQVELKDRVRRDNQSLKPAANSYQYYAIAMTAMFILYFAEVGIDMFARGRRQRTLQRELITPVSRQRLINATVGGHLVYGLLVVAVLMGITQLLFDVPWQQAFIFSFLNISSLMALFLVLGVFLETIGQKVGVGIVQVIIQLVAFLGGGYFPVSDFMLRFSPLGWVMGPIRSALWTENGLNWQGVGLNLGLTVILFVGLSLVLRKREVF